MLKKLFCHDFNAIKRKALPFLLTVLGFSLLSLGILLLHAILPKMGKLSTFFDNTLTSLLLALLFAAAVLVFLAGLQIFSHYYKSFFTDEGYFTFMLPVSREELLVSKILAGASWCLIILVTLVLTATLGVILPFEILMRAENASFVTGLWRSIVDSVTVFGILDLLFSLLAQTVFLYTAITCGALFFAKRKVLGAFLSYFLLSGIVALLRTAFSLILLVATDEGDIFVSLFSILLSFTVGVGGYLITRALLKQKLDLV